MRTRLKFVCFLIALVVAGAVAYLLAYPSVYVNYRLTLEVETPEGVKTGSSVVRLHYGLQPELVSGRCEYSTVNRGEAVRVELGARGALYALLIGRNSETGAPDTYLSPPTFFIKALAPGLWSSPSCSKTTLETLKRLNVKTDVPTPLIPFLVRFRDEKDPTSVEAVDPENLAASFGEGVRLKRVIMQTTSDPVTTGIEKRLGWLNHLTAGSITGMTRWDPSKPDPVNYLTAISFKRGTHK